MPGRASLDAAYRAARYCIVVGGHTRCAAIDRANPALDLTLRRRGCHAHWCLLTPCNPGSRRWTPSQNAVRLRRLRRIAQDRGWRSLPAYNASRDGRWIEPGLCILDATPRSVDQLARRFGQLAWVFGRLGSAAQLVWIAQPRRSI